MEGTAPRYPRLFSEGRIGPLRFRNRILSSPMEKNLVSPDGSVTQGCLDNIRERSRGEPHGQALEGRRDDLRWMAAGLTEAEKGFRRVWGYQGMAQLSLALARNDKRLNAEAETVEAACP